MPTPSYTDDLRIAHLLADNADSITLSRFRARDLDVRLKPDSTHVTDADEAVEASIRKLLGDVRRRDAVRGEEGEDTGWGPRQWVIDPIDGTANFVRGVPVWATLIALLENGQPVVGVVSAPALNRRWWASLGDGAFAGKNILNGTELHVSSVDSLADASLSYSSIDPWVESGRGQQFVDLLRMCWRTRGFGDFWQYMLLAEGTLDVATEPQLALHDMAACSIIVDEAGGSFTNLDGDPGPVGPGALATNGRLHDAVVAQLAPEDEESSPEA